MTHHYDYLDDDLLGYRRVEAYEADHPDLDGQGIGRALTARATRAQLRAFAISYVDNLVTGLRRQRARAAEDRAAANGHRDAAASAERRDGEHEALFDDPTRYPGGAADRRRFRRWAGDRFEEWYQRGRDLAAARGERELTFFESDWYEAGVHAYWEDRHIDQTRELLKTVAAETRLETTRELLATMFALGDGTEVSWGDATAEQHGQRVDMLVRNAAGVVETAARHQAAVRMITTAGVACLNELAAVSAA